MRNIYALLFVALFAFGCSGSDEKATTKFYLTADGVQRPFFAEATDDVNADGENAVLVYADKTDEQLTFDVRQDTTGDNVVEHVEFIPSVADGTLFYLSGASFSEITVNTENRLKGTFAGNMTDGDVEKYVEFTFDIIRESN
ncbi:MAG: hypothetical protein EOO50_05400 [Flavobacterium sp.]|uniref:hypothetical protein n=1 Tax=Flavobacterium sp. TaxID=239 RepID=UPI00120B32F0|nr:hypothetical protein [Flavobacterium sp.]RZJ67424.1 MAG: hypothetical protein EOO50_05400 [Flavobacterium sp.]